MRVHSLLVQGAGSALAGKLGSMLASTAQPLEALVLMSLGVDHSTIADAIKQNKDSFQNCQSIYLTETYGILGFDEDAGANVELMEKGEDRNMAFVEEAVAKAAS